MPEEREVAPVFFEFESVDQSEEYRDEPAEWSNEFCRRELKRLIVENDRAIFESVSAEESLKE